MAWLAWVAAGAWGLARLPLLRRMGTHAFAAGVALAGPLLAVQIVLVRGARLELGVTRGALVEFGPMVAAVILILCPVCLLVGCLFTSGARLTVERGGTAGQAYIWESVGAVVGGTLFSFLFIRYLDPFQTAFLVGILDLTLVLQLLKPPTLWASDMRPPTADFSAPCDLALASYFRPFVSCLLPLASCLVHSRPRRPSHRSRT